MGWLSFMYVFFVSSMFCSFHCVRLSSPWLIPKYFIHFIRNLLSFLDVYIHVFHQISFFQLLFSSISSLPHSLSLLLLRPWCACWFLDGLPRPLRLCSLFSNHFPPCSSDSIISFVLSSSSLILLTAQVCLSLQPCVA